MTDKKENLLSQIKNCSPAEFETLVLNCLLKIEKSEHGEVTGRSGDEGIDGFVQLDNLGLGKVFFQAKRWDETVVGRPEIQKFVGALHGKKGLAGVFVTASSYTKEAQEYVKQLDLIIRLIDGEELVNLIVKNSLENLVKSDPDSSLKIESKATHNELILCDKGYLLKGDGAKELSHLIHEGLPLVVSRIFRTFVEG
jgi:restriction endonuclease Mrr